MTNSFPRSMQKLIEELNRMPGVGPRSAERLAFHVLKAANGDMAALVNAIRDVKREVKFCKECNNLSEGDMCHICSDPVRDRGKLCVVEGPKGVLAMERSGAHRGLYHVLMGELSPIEGIGPDELGMDDLVKRVLSGGVKEVIVATDFTMEGETTALYIAGILKGKNIKVSRLAQGVPVGAMIEYADTATLQMAFEERRSV